MRLPRTVRGQAAPPPAGVNVGAMETGSRGHETEASAPLHSHRTVEAHAVLARHATPEMLGGVVRVSQSQLPSPRSVKVTVKSQNNSLLWTVYV